MTSIYQPLLDLIASVESEPACASQHVSSGYDVVVHQAFRVYPPAIPISTMTVSGVLVWQRSAVKAYRAKHGSSIGFSAAGRYQIIRPTLQTLVATKQCKESDLFDATTQDALAFSLLKTRGYTGWEKGSISSNRFADSIAREWASFPMANGNSAYAGDSAGNKALIGRKVVMQVLESIKESMLVR